MSEATGSEDRSLVEAELKGKTLQIYWLLIREAQPLGVREIQRTLGFTSPSVAHYHLEKLRRLGLVTKDQYERYILAEKVDVGVLHAFTRIGGLMLPRYIFYAAFFTTLLIVYLIQHGLLANIFAVAFAVTGILAFSYESFRAWRRRPV